jgi:hypothetical protein
MVESKTVRSMKHIRVIIKLRVSINLALPYQKARVIQDSFPVRPEDNDPHCNETIKPINETCVLAIHECCTIYELQLEAEEAVNIDLDFFQCMSFYYLLRNLKRELPRAVLSDPTRRKTPK